jgi:hypothetical protein
MGHDASQILGSPQLAGVIVSPVGAGLQTGAKFGGAGGGLAGAVVAAAVASKATKESAEAAAVSTAPEFGRWGFLAVTDDELALVDLASTRAGRLKLGDVLVRIPRAQVASCEVGGARTALPPPLTISFGGGDTWLLEVPRWARKQAGKVVGLLASGEPASGMANDGSAALGPTDREDSR